MKWRLAAFMLMIGVCHALGQSAPTNPPMTYGMVPTVGQWISWFQQKQDVLGSAPLTTAGGTMLGRLNLFPSSLARAGTNLGVGVTPTAPVDGDIWITASGAFTQVNGSTVSFGIPLGSGVGALLSGVATGTGGPVGSIAPIFTGSPPTIPGLPGLTINVEGGGQPGLDMPSCLTAATCTWEIFSSPTAYPAANNTTLFVTKVAPASGGAFGSTYSAIEAQGVTGLNDPGFQWTFQSVLHERTLASQLSQNVGMASSVFKELNGQSAGTQIGHYDAAFYGQCVDETAVVNPTGSCQVAEFDVLTFVGAGTDSNHNRLGVQINGGVNNGTDTGVHIGTLLSLGAQHGAVIDTAFQISDTTTKVYQIFGNGGTQITSNFGSWSGVNVGKQLIVMPESNATVNPAIGLSDLNSTNFVAMENSTGTIIIEGMPALNDTTSTPTVFAKFAAASITFPNLPTSAGSGGLIVCVDVSGNFYKKAACP